MVTTRSMRAAGFISPPGTPSLSSSGTATPVPPVESTQNRIHPELLVQRLNELNKRHTKLKRFSIMFVIIASAIIATSLLEHRLKEKPKIVSKTKETRFDLASSSMGGRFLGMENTKANAPETIIKSGGCCIFKGNKPLLYLRLAQKAYVEEIEIQLFPMAFSRDDDGDVSSALKDFEIYVSKPVLEDVT